MDRPGAVNKNSKKDFIFTKSFILMKISYNLKFLIFQGQKIQKSFISWIDLAQ